MENCVGVTMANNEGAPQFPYGVRVLVVDDSVVCLKYVTLLLHKCGYQVTAKENSAEALLLLKQNEDNFDIVLTNVHMHEIDGFKLLEAGLEHDIPVIMISANDDLEIIKKGVRHGAVDYLVKPVRLGEIKNIWQHVYRKNPRVASPNRKDNHEMPSNKGAVKRGRRKSNGDGFESGSKRDRVRWTPALHTKFVDCVTKLGGVDKAVPLKILEMMGEKNITREKVASHLQKYRKAIKEMVRDDDGKKKLRKNSSSNSNSRPQRVVPKASKVSHDSRRHPIFENNNAIEGPLVVAPPVMMHQHPQFVASNGWMGVNDRVDQALPPPQFMPGEVMHQCNMSFDRTIMEGNSLPIVNHSVHPHHQQCHPSFGQFRSIYSDPHQHQHQYQHQSYGNSDVRSAQDTHDVFYGDIPHVSGNSSLLDAMLANDFFDQ